MDIIKMACTDVCLEDKKQILYNTRRIMESYRDLKKYVSNAVSDEREVKDSIYDCLKGENIQLKAIKQSKMMTAMMITNIERALKEMEEESIQAGTEYKFKAFKMYYVEGLTFEEIAEQLGSGKNSPANWNKKMLKKMAVKLYGINAV